MKTSSKTRKLVATSFKTLFVLLLASAPLQAQSDGWDWDLGLYLWASDVKADVGDDSIEISFSDLIDKVEMAGSVHFEGRRGRGGFLTDLMIISLADEATAMGHPDLPDGTLLDLAMDLTLVEIGGFWRPSGRDEGFDLLAGIRFLIIDDELVITPPGAPPMPQESSDTSVTDAYIGARYSLSLSPRWGFMIRADIGAGDTDLIWNTTAYLSVGVGRKGNKDIIFGYRRLQLDLGDDQIESQVEMSGPVVAFAFGF